LNHAFEHDTGRNSVTGKILDATKTLDVLIWFCGLSSPASAHPRVEARVAAGGHIATSEEEKSVSRYRPKAQTEPHQTHAARRHSIRSTNNSAEAAADGTGA